MPNRSKASRSNQLALAHTSTTESTTGSAECPAHLEERARVGVVGQLALERGPAPDAAAEPRVDLQGESFVELAQALSHSSSDYRAIVLVRAIFFCSCTIPYTSASAVGGHPGT